MRRVLAVTLAMTLALAGAVGACARGRGASAEVVASAAADTLDAPIREDSVRGIVRLVGSSPGNLTLRPASGGVLDLMGEDLALLRAADGLEVALFGQFGPASGVTTSAAGFVITWFAVRAVDGNAAIDGVLERAGDGFALRLSDGALISLPMVPEPLRTAAGMRVFWVGPLDSAPRAYGILGTARRSH